MSSGETSLPPWRRLTQPLRPEVFVVTHRLRVVVQTLDAQIDVDVADREALSDAQPEVVVHRQVQALVEPSGRLEAPRVKEDCGRIDPAAEVQLRPELERSGAS